MKFTLSLAEDRERAPIVIEVPDNPRLESEVLIGRADDCDMQIVEPSVSRHHCGIVVSTGEQSVRVRDRGSVNGTFINDQRIDGLCDIHDGDKLTVGFVPLTIGLAGEASAWDRAAERYRNAQVSPRRRFERCKDNRTPGA
jgi:predicted component of type VI protein secretion system